MSSSQSATRRDKASGLARISSFASNGLVKGPPPSCRTMGVADSSDSGGIIVRSKYCRTGHDCIRTCLDRLSGSFTIFSAVNLDDRIKAARLAEPAQTADVGQRLRQKFLTAEACFDGHDENDVAETENVFDRLDRARRVEYGASFLAEVVDLREDLMECVRGGRLRVDENMIGAGLRKGDEMALRLDDHQMHIERLLRRAAHRLDDQRPDRDIGHEAAIHNVDMNPVGARSVDGANFVGKMSEVR